MGITGIQFAALSGLKVITTASPHNHAYLKSLGAAHVVDYKSPTAVDEIRAITEGKLSLAWDCQSDAASAAFCGRCLDQENGGHYSSLLYGNDELVKSHNAKAKTNTGLYYSVFGEDFYYKGTKPAVPENYEFGRMFWEVGRQVLAEGKVKPIRTIVNRGGSGLEGVIVGLKEVQEGKVSAGKLVYTLA
jgi:NADPH:quinone reductase-like Zn-dependent oxidoreductase